MGLDPADAVRHRHQNQCRQQGADRVQHQEAHRSDPAQIDIGHLRHLLLKECKQEHESGLDANPAERMRGHHFSERGEAAWRTRVLFRQGLDHQEKGHYRAGNFSIVICRLNARHAPPHGINVVRQETPKRADRDQHVQ